MTDPYGLSINNPVLCGGGPEGEQDYLDRLRCPSGSRIRYRRLGSQVAGTPDGPRPLPIDVYEIECACGEHSARVFMDMYHRGEDNATKCVEISGWTLQPW